MPETPTKKLTPLQNALLAMKKMRKKLDAYEKAKDEPIAIIGMGCRFPAGSDTPEKFWRLFEEGIDAVTEVPEERKAVRLWDDGELGDTERKGIKWASFIDHPDRFDALFFGISPREAAYMDPRQRVLLEVAWEALEDAGQVPERLVGSKTGVYIGMTTNDYQQCVISNRPEEMDFYAFTGLGDCFLSGRISYTLGLQGPSLCVATACSSSLVTVHLAVESLRRGESDMAIAGGINLILSPQLTFVFAGSDVAMAPDGRCKAFDSRANGIVRGEGCGLVVLKRLSDALAAGDRILAVIRASAVNQDGRSTGVVAPNVLAQQALLESALAQAKLSPEDISYIETHGTGTPLGDPIEFEALKAVIGKPRKDDSPCVLGAAKTNLGHLEGAAGIAGLIKVVLAMRHGKIPRNLHFKKLNPRISLTGTPFVIPTEEVPWPAGKEPRRAGVSSFGASGTNAHVILEEAPAQPEVAPERVMRHHLLPLSARSPEALRDLAGVWRDFFQRDPESTGARLHDICYTASRRRMHHEYRLSVVADSSRAFAERLGMFLDGDPPAGLTQGRKRPSRTYETVFVFPGYGSQWVGMGRTLLETEPVFRETIEACDAAIRQEETWSLLSVLTAPEADSRLGEIEILQPALLAVEIALARLWMSWGVRPDAVVGHSMGEIAAAHLAGALSLEDAMRLVCRRSRLLARMTGTGASAVIGLSYEEAAAALEPYGGRITIAVNNSPRSTLISGEAKAVEALVDALEARGVFCRRMTPKIAAHSPQMEPYLPELTEALAGISPQESQITFFSTALGRSLAGSDLTADYWARNLREPVLFYHAVRKLVEEGHTVFIEMSPHPLLLDGVEAALAEAKREGIAVGSLRRNQDEAAMLLEALGALHANGYPIDWGIFYPKGNVVSIPTYAWQRERYWFEGGKSVSRPRRSPPQGKKETVETFLGEHFEIATQPGTHCWQLEIDLDRIASLAYHKIEDVVVLPGLTYIDMALAAAAEIYPEAVGCVEDVSFSKAMFFRPGETRTVQLYFTPRDDGNVSFEILSRTREEPEKGWVRHVTGTLRLTDPDAVPFQSDVAERFSALPHAWNGPDFYTFMRGHNTDLGPFFLQAMEEIRCNHAGEAIGRLRPPREVQSLSSVYHVDLDLPVACLAVFFATLSEETIHEFAKDYFSLSFVTHLERLRVWGRLDKEVLYSHAVLREVTQEPTLAVVSDLFILDGAGNVLLEIRGMLGKTLNTLLDAIPQNEDREALQRLQEEIAALPTDAQRHAAIVAKLREQVAGTLRLSPDRVDPDRELTSIGIDSLMAMELIKKLERRFGYRLPIADMIEGPTIEWLAGKILAAWQGDKASDAPTPTTADRPAPPLHETP